MKQAQHSWLMKGNRIKSQQKKRELPSQIGPLYSSINGQSQVVISKLASNHIILQPAPILAETMNVSSDNEGKNNDLEVKSSGDPFENNLELGSIPAESMKHTFTNLQDTKTQKN